MDGCGFIAMTAFQIFRHNLIIALPFKIAKQKHTLTQVTWVFWKFTQSCRFCFA
jgi:hypothetical protein